MGRAPCCDKNGLKKGPWTPEEDQKLIDYIQNNGYGNWRTLPKNAGLQRCGKSCRLRWTNYLRPDIKRGRFSFEEEETIIQLHSILGNKWSAIAARLPGRTDNEIKNYWNTHIRKRLLRMGIDPVTHSPRLDLLDLSSILNSSFNHHPSSSSSTTTSQMNLSRLFGTVQPLFNPELLKLATSILSSNKKINPNPNPNPTLLQNQNQNQNLLFCNNYNNTQIQNQFHQDHHLPPLVQQLQDVPNFSSEEVAQLMQPNSSSDQIFFHSNNSYISQNCHDLICNNNNNQQWQNDADGVLLQTTTTLSNDYHHQQMALQNYGGSMLLMDGSDDNNFSFRSVLSSATPSSSSPMTPLNSNSSINNNYMNNNNNSSSCTTTEDERESYCSIDMLKFEIPDILDVSEFICNN